MSKNCLGKTLPIRVPDPPATITAYFFITSFCSFLQDLTCLPIGVDTLLKAMTCQWPLFRRTHKQDHLPGLQSRPSSQYSSSVYKSGSQPQSPYHPRRIHLRHCVYEM